MLPTIVQGQGVDDDEAKLVACATKSNEALDNWIKVREQLAHRKADLHKRRGLLEATRRSEAETWGNPEASDSDRLKMNVGGERMTIERRHLCSPRAPFLASIFSGRWDKRLPRDGDGRIFLDFDREAFVILRDSLVDGAEASVEQPAPLASTSRAVRRFFHLHEPFSLPSPKPRGSFAPTPTLDRMLNEHGAVGPVELLYSASRDGWNTDALFRLAGGHDNILIVADCNPSQRSHFHAFLKGPLPRSSKEALSRTPALSPSFLINENDAVYLRAQSRTPMVCLDSPSSQEDVQISLHKKTIQTYACGSWVEEGKTTSGYHISLISRNLTDLHVHRVLASRDEVAVARATREGVAAGTKLRSTSGQRAASDGTQPLHATHRAADLASGLATALDNESAALAVLEAQMRREEAMHAHELLMLDALCREDDDILRLDVAGPVDVWRSVLTQCPGSQLAAQFSDRGRWDEGDDDGVPIDANSVQFRRLVSFLRLRAMPAKLCGGDPKQLARQFLQSVPAAEMAAFERTVDFYFPAAAKAFVMSAADPPQQQAAS